MNKLRIAFAAVLALALLAMPSTALAGKGDRDGDKMPDRFEKRHKLSTKKRDGKADKDRDGLSNLGEFRSKTNPRDADSDNDGVRDSDEDRDRDKVDNANELREGTDPRDADSDDDGRRDGREDRDRDRLSNAAEDATGNDPRDRDTDDDGVKDGREQAGVILSFVEGVLTIDLANGKTLSGRVTSDTEIYCETEDDFENGGDEGEGPELDRERNRVEAATPEEEGHEPDQGDDEPDQGDDEEPGDDELDFGDDEEHGDGEHGNEPDATLCDASDLERGTPVHEAELSLSGEGATFDMVELVVGEPSASDARRGRIVKPKPKVKAKVRKSASISRRGRVVKPRPKPKPQPRVKLKPKNRR